MAARSDTRIRYCGDPITTAVYYMYMFGLQATGTVCRMVAATKRERVCESLCMCMLVLSITVFAKVIINKLLYKTEPQNSQGY